MAAEAWGTEASAGHIGGGVNRESPALTYWSTSPRSSWSNPVVPIEEKGRSITEASVDGADDRQESHLKSLISDQFYSRPPGLNAGGADQLGWSWICA